MATTLKYLPILSLLLLLDSVAIADDAGAGIELEVEFDTSALMATGKNYTLHMHIVDGGLDEGDNQVLLSDFDFGDGSAVGVLVTSGSVLGTLAPGITLSDSSPLSFARQLFRPGAVIRFKAAFGPAHPSLSPDGFSVSILDETGRPLPTHGEVSEFLNVSLHRQKPNIELYSSIAGAGQVEHVPAPATTVETTAETHRVRLWLEHDEAGQLTLIIDDPEAIADETIYRIEQSQDLAHWRPTIDLIANDNQASVPIPLDLGGTRKYFRLMRSTAAPIEHHDE